MKKIPFNQAAFIAAVFDLKSLPTLVDIEGKRLPEIALVGRSNVGKSSLINHLLNRRSLAKTSSTPGKTQSINFFTIDGQVALVDLPGYGYAKVSKEIKKKWAPLIESYLEHSQHLRLILLLIDSRRELTEEDLNLIQWASFHNKSLLLICTKSDKLSAGELQKHAKHFSFGSFLYYSIKDPKARIRLIETINTRLQEHGPH